MASVKCWISVLQFYRLMVGILLFTHFLSANAFLQSSSHSRFSVLLIRSFHLPLHEVQLLLAFLPFTAFCRIVPASLGFEWTSASQLFDELRWFLFGSFCFQIRLSFYRFPFSFHFLILKSTVVCFLNPGNLLPFKAKKHPESIKLLLSFQISYSKSEAKRS